MQDLHSVAFFCNEFAVDSDLPTYSGGLGTLSSDILNQAADEEFPMVGIGILYKGKEFVQHITGEGKMETRDTEFDHDSSFLRPVIINGKPVVVTLDLESTKVLVKTYKIRLSQKVILYFLSADVDGNPPEWVSDMDTLYKGDISSQIRQQILLGVGGIKLLNAIGVKPTTYHINEGRPSLVIWELAANIMQTEKISFQEAWDAAKNNIVYTNHTLVAAGNLEYPVSIIENWATPFARAMGVDTSLLIKDGIINPQTFSITLFALNTSKKHSAVSKIHQVSAKRIWPKHEWVGITNGVHNGRWQDSDFRNPNLNDRQLWDLHMTKKRELMETVIKRTGFGYDPQRLVVTWARRLAEYKQPKIIFSDIERLKSIIFSEERPIQLLFAGNSHTGDVHAKELIEDIIKIFTDKLSGHAIFIPNYNISLANHLTSGSDLWLNTPKGNLEACGTSGMKAISNGVLNCTVADGWTYEVDWKDIGWTLDPNNIPGSFYNILENEIVPLYFQKDSNGLPSGWIQRMKASINLSKNYTTERVLREYIKYLY